MVLWWPKRQISGVDILPFLHFLHNEETGIRVGKGAATHFFHSHQDTFSYNQALSFRTSCQSAAKKERLASGISALIELL